MAPTYETRDKKTIITLVASGLKPCGVRYDGNTMYFAFDPAPVEPILRQYLSGEPMLINIHAIWRAEDLFKSYLRSRKV